LRRRATINGGKLIKLAAGKHMPDSFNWSPGIADSTFANWATVILYLFTSWRCLVVARAPARWPRTAEREYLAWWGLAVLFFVLGVNKQLGLESALTKLGRAIVFHGGWAEYKFAIQLGLISAVLVFCILMGWVLAVLIRHAHSAAWLAILGAILVMGFVAVRAVSLHDIDQFIDSRFLMLRWNWILEIGGTLLVLLASIWRYARTDH
jgi:hypothetical protein